MHDRTTCYYGRLSLFAHSLLWSFFRNSRDAFDQLSDRKIPGPIGLIHGVLYIQCLVGDIICTWCSSLNRIRFFLFFVTVPPKVEAGSGVRATISGKPSSGLGLGILKRHGFDPARTCMIGDRLDSDIIFGINAGKIQKDEGRERFLEFRKAERFVIFIIY